MVSSGQEQQLSELFDGTASVMHTSEKNLSFMSSSNTGSSSSNGQSIPFFNVTRPLPMVRSSIDCEASKLLVVSNVRWMLSVKVVMMTTSRRKEEEIHQKRRKGIACIVGILAMTLSEQRNALVE